MAPDNPEGAIHLLAQADEAFAQSRRFASDIQSKADANRPAAGSNARRNHRGPPPTRRTLPSSPRRRSRSRGRREVRPARTAAHADAAGVPPDMPVMMRAPRL